MLSLIAVWIRWYPKKKIGSSLAAEVLSDLIMFTTVL